jgi:hypothetical protein
MFDTSRYADGRFSQAINKRRSGYDIFVLRDFNVPTIQKYKEYQVTDGDRIDILADIFLGTPYAWHLIMDINPGVPDPFNLKIGTVLRIPVG